MMVSCLTLIGLLVREVKQHDAQVTPKRHAAVCRYKDHDSTRGACVQTIYPHVFSDRPNYWLLRIDFIESFV